MYTTSTDIDSYSNLQQMLKRFNLVLTEEYIKSAAIKAIIIGLICAACFALAVVFIKHSRGLGVTAAIMQFVGLFAASKYVIAFSKIDFSKFVVIEYGNSYEDATNKAMNSMMDTYMEVLPAYAGMMIWSLLLLAAVIFSLIYIVKIMNSGIKVLGVSALILTIAKFIVSPLNAFSLFTKGGLSLATQMKWDGFYTFIYILPALLVAALAIINFVKEKKNPAPQDEADAK